MRVAAAQLPPMHASADKIFTTGNAVIMLDGASAIEPVPVAPDIYADALGTHLRDHLDADPAADLVEVLAAAIADVTAHCGLRAGHSPSSTVTIVRHHGDDLDVLVLGDNLVVLPPAAVSDDRMDRLDLAARRAYRQRLAAGYGFDDEHRRTLRDLQAAQAGLRNRAGGYWIAEADPRAAHHAVTRRFPVADVPWAVLATDGAYEPVRHLNIDDWAHLATLTSTGLHDLLSQCQDWEATVDPLAQDLPRAKQSDDKSLALATFHPDGD